MKNGNLLSPWGQIRGDCRVKGWKSTVSENLPCRRAHAQQIFRGRNSPISIGVEVCKWEWKLSYCPGLLTMAKNYGLHH
ncbi:hypothetical protein TNCV_2065291 [Trichonephila clavipes]|nr:hypothetical protein TNCV_2065291 [Trichonephila clavipes]